jgi:Uncharacterised protein family (UPF0158)
MLDPEQVDLGDLALALEDHSQEHGWWLDPETGEVEPRFADRLEEFPFGPDAGSRLIPIEPLASAVGYADMEDFVSRIREPRTRELLERAIAGRGAFRRFKDALLEYPELRGAWFAFHDARGERRAIEWLLERDLIRRPAAKRALARRPEPAVGDVPGMIDATGIAQGVMRDLRRLYRERLESVMLLGPWASGEAHPESELELLVILADFADRWDEKRRMDKIMWRHSVRNDTVVTATPVTPAELRDGATPVLARALIEGVRVD